ncbi:hypothetical protein VE23_05100 [Paenibacillus sp. D9]|uniref:hypothetical protein n=1 Tax=Paenibacillus sp. D9 TaxID=665792 RepID=UPI00061EAC38|nr:hypothetical protein [Paenibacillus sp. D9]KKC46642.1 hypothetical protein VE23_05100 [Paenibacillus sp. D9]
MKWEIIHAEMTVAEDGGYVGQVQFKIEGHKQAYEIALQSNKRGKDWAYGLFFKDEAGPEAEIEAVEEELEDNDEFYEALIAAAKDALKQD